MWVFFLHRVFWGNSVCQIGVISRGGGYDDVLAENRPFVRWEIKKLQKARLEYFFGFIVRSIVNIKPVWAPTFIEGGAKCIDHIFRIILIEKLSVSDDATGIVDESNQKRFPPFSIGLLD